MTTKESVRGRVLISLVPVAAICFDYSMTLFHAGSAEALLTLEYSPLMRFAVAHGVVLLYLASMMAAYFIASMAVLTVFRGTALLPFGYATILMVGINHVLGGLSWVVRASLYSRTVILLSYGPVVLAVAALIYALFLWLRADRGSLRSG